MDSLLKELPISASIQIANTRSKARKILWIVLFFLSTLLAIYQTVAITLAYFKFSVIETVTTEVSVESPVITFCVNNAAVRRDNPDVDDEMIEIFNKVSGLSSECNTTILSLFCLSLLTSKERFNIGYKQLSAVPQLHGLFYETMARSRYYLQFNNLYYGNCATIGTTNISYLLRTYAPVVENHLRPMFDPSAIAVVHTQEFSPVFTPENVFISSGKGQNMIYVTKSENRRKPWPYENMCVDEQTHPIRSWIILDRNNTNITKFKYSRQFCLDQCLYNLTAKYCKCILPKSLIDINEDKLPICTNRCGKIPEDKLQEMCNCRQECKNTHYKFHKCLAYPIENDELFKFAYTHFRNTFGENYRLGQLDQDSFESYGLTDKRNLRYTRFIVLVNRVVEVLTETAEFELEAMLSNIGGIWGMWIGISTLTLIEVISKLIKGKWNSKAIQSYKCQMKLRAFIWTSIKLLCATVATWQAYITLMDYLECNVIQVSTTVSREQPVFPSVTICTNEFLKFREDRFPINSTVRLYLNKWSNFTDSEKSLQLEEYLGNLSFSSMDELLLLTPIAQDFVTSCKYETANGNQYDCMDKVVEFKEKYDYGMTKTCAHINPKLLRSNASTEIFPKDLFIKMESLFYDLLMPLWSVVDVSIHSPGTTPFLNANEHVVIAPGDHVDVKFTTKQFQRLPHPYTSDCVDEESDSVVWLNNFYDGEDQSSYRYTMESCLRSCMLNASFNSFNCHMLTTTNSHLIREAIRIQFHENGNIEDGLRPCTDDEPIFQNIFSNHTMCGCKQPCRSVSYELEMHRTPFVYKKKTKSDEIGLDSVVAVLKRVNTGASGIRIRPASREIQIVTEVPKIETFSLVGLIGGVFGLWIGISIVSFVETFHSMASTFIAKIGKGKTNNAK